MIKPTTRSSMLYGKASNIYPLTPMTIPSKKKTALVHEGLNIITKYAIAIKINMIAVAMTSFVNGWWLKIGAIPHTISIKASITPSNLNILTFAIITLILILISLYLYHYIIK